MNSSRFFRSLLAGGALWVAIGLAHGQEGKSPARFRFREARRRELLVEGTNVVVTPQGNRTEWLRARWEDGPRQPVLVGPRLALHLRPGSDVTRLLAGRALKLSRRLGPDVFVLEAADAWTALREAARFSEDADVVASYPIVRRKVKLAGGYADLPNDPYFSGQWHLENRAPNGQSLGVDLNVRSAWTTSLGEKVVIAIVDDGVELTHPELAAAAAGAPHFNFYLGLADGSPSEPGANHSTAVAGLALARGNNGRGISGVAPRARLASWVIFDGDFFAVDSVGLMDMFQYSSDVVSVQNHSWGTDSTTFDGPSPLEQIGLNNAVQFGRNGRGIVIVRAAGNDAQDTGDANADGYDADARVVTVGAVRSDGRVTKYSNRGACVLVAAPSGEITDNGLVDSSFPTLFTTDRQGTLGFNTGVYSNDLADYGFADTGFNGTSGSAPQIAGLAALVLAANTNLTYRDVQQILIHASRHLDFHDGDLATNGAGFRVSHGAGFGVPDAGVAVRLASRWTNRPALVSHTWTATNAVPIPDDGLRVGVFGSAVPANLISIHASPDYGAQPDDLTMALSIVDAGLADAPLGLNLTGKVALIQRGGNLFRDKIEVAAQAGASAAIIFNNRDGATRLLMASTESVPIPAVLIDQIDGESLRAYVQTNAGAQVQFQLQSANYSFAVTKALLCEHVGLRVQSDHPRRGDLRITLHSPQGTRSVMQRVNSDPLPGPVDWTYISTHHFYEASVGNWTASITDESAGTTGQVLSVSLILEGVALSADADGDGLDDAWELANFGTLNFGPRDDPDGDGYSNAREQVLGSNPLAAEGPFRLDVARFNARLARLSWPASTNYHYEVLTGPNAPAPLSVLTNIAGTFPEAELFTPRTNAAYQFFRVRRVGP
jgi:subtilisin family serine protease/subtilisin-like proprotein convertase family protein